jgi:pimeloyl-ACP methyl ester carboxylesterase
MRKAARVVFLFLVGVLSSVVLGVLTALTAAVSLAATALIVPGTGTPDAGAVKNYMENARDYYMTDTACVGTGCNLIPIDYPASFWPLPFPGWCRSGPDGCDKWDESVGKGTTALISKLEPFLDPNSTEDVVIFGYSQGGAVVANVLKYLDGLDLPESTRDRIEVVTIGGIQNPNGGLWPRASFIGFLPIFDVSFRPAMTLDVAGHTTAVGFQYDPVTLAPRFWGNPFAMFNAIAAFDDVHGFYLSPNGNDEKATLPYGYTPDTLRGQLDCGLHPANCREDQYGNTYIIIPATTLPIMDFVLSTA